MKVISIRQPWASLIIHGYKEYEFRSWNTSFRGKVLIHASKTVEKNVLKRFEHLNLDYPVGQIIGSVEIIDCVKVDEDFGDKLLLNNELIYGTIKSRGGYAFKLDKITSINPGVKINGQLSFWNFYEENEIMDLMINIEYGWVDDNNISHSIVDDTFSDNYRLQAPKDIIKSKMGVCWDQVELERYYFKSSPFKVTSYFICYYDNEECPCHTFLTYQKNDKYYWFEHSWGKYRGIHEFNSLRELLRDIYEKFSLDLPKTFAKDNLILRTYDRPLHNSTPLQFYQHCEKEKIIDIDNL